MIPPSLANLKNRAMHCVARTSEVLNARSPREKIMILLFGLAGVLVLNYWIWVAPVIGALSEGLPLRARLKSEIAELKEYESTKDKIARRHEELGEELSAADRALVGYDQVPALLENLSATARQTGVKITSLSPVEGGERRSGKTYSAVPIQILATAGAHELGRFVDALETGELLMKVTNVKITADSAGGKQHKIELGLEAFRTTESTRA